MNLYTQTKGRIVGNEVVDKSIQEASDTSSGTVNEIMDDEPDMWEQGLDYMFLKQQNLYLKD